MIAALRDVGVEAFLAYGTLLGAVREGKVIGNDSDADLGYVSHHTHPVDVIRESFRIQRALIGLGYRITRYSALAFKVDVDEGDGVVRGLDVFGGFLMDGHLHLMGEIREPFEESWIFPLGTTTLEGRTFPAPADPDRLLTATYGASWRVPDPAFHFAPPATTVRRLNGWFRGLRVGRARWDRIYSRVLKGDARAVAVRRMGRPASSRSAGDVRRPRLRPRRRRPVHGERGVPSLGLDFQPRSFAEAERQTADNRPRDVPGAEPARDPPGAAGSARPAPAGPGAGAHRPTPGRHARPRGPRASSCGGWPDDARRRGRAGGSTWSSWPRFGDGRVRRASSGSRRRSLRMIVAELEAAGAPRSCTARRSRSRTHRAPRRCAG